jgi:hypothetical protein
MFLNSNALGALCNLYLPEGSQDLPSGGLGPQMAKIPLNANPYGIAFWSDPDPTKYFDLQNLTQFTSVDFYFTLGNFPTQTPLRFNGGRFSLKLGILVNTNAEQSVLAGTAAQGRVVKRTRAV